MIDIKELQAIAADRKNIEITAHAFLQLKARNIKLADIYAGIENGEIIEQYPNDKYYPSCLILYFRMNGKPVHFVCGMGDNRIYIITAYNPDLERWESDYKTRKKVSL
ncbi:MAG: DUF4258 domain-containing protein [Ruminiclostridium sp.]|nr:DUF4258 domain-containing protein [Ruminiclostridium sp.]